METLNSVFRNLFPFKGFKVFVLENGNRVLLGLQSSKVCGICPICSKRCRRVEMVYERTIRDLDLAGTPCFVQFLQKKICCKCGYRGPEKLDWVSKSHRVSVRMETYVACLCEKMTLKDASIVSGLNWKTVKEVDKEYIKKLLPDISKLNITRIAMDEIAIMKGHKYVTIIRDYDTGIVITIVLGRAYETVRNALLELGKERLAQIKYVSLDMWDPYIKAIKECCPNAELIFDKFHVVKKVNEALDTVRKEAFASASKEERINMKQKRFVILKREQNLDKKEREKLHDLMHNNELLYKSYLIKEQLLNIFDDKTSTFDQIKERIDTWFSNILSNELTTFYGVVNMIKTHLHGILNYFRYGMTNAISEGFNTKINIIKRRAYGIRDLEYFKLKICQSSIRRFP
jgi:transposase